MKSKSICFFLLAVCFCACQKKYDDATYMSFDNLKYVTSFANEHVYEKSKGERITSFYGRCFRVIDNYLIEETGGGKSFWRVTNRQTGDSKLMAHNGHGEYEFMSNPRLDEANFYIEAGEVHCLTNDYRTGKTFDINISRSLGDSTCISRGPNIPTSTFNALIFSDSIYMYRSITKKEDQQIRYVISKGNLISSPAADRLNAASVPPREDFNILSSIMAYNKKNGLILEAPICLNTINNVSSMN